MVLVEDCEQEAVSCIQAHLATSGATTHGLYLVSVSRESSRAQVAAVAHLMLTGQLLRWPSIYEAWSSRVVEDKGEVDATFNMPRVRSLTCRIVTKIAVRENLKGG